MVCCRVRARMSSAPVLPAMWCFTPWCDSVQDKGGIICMPAKAKTKANRVLMQCTCRSCELLSHGPCGKSKNYLISLLQSDFSSHSVHPRHLWDGFHRQNPQFQWEKECTFNFCIHGTTEPDNITHQQQ